jgi:hypothetical protein
VSEYGLSGNGSFVAFATTAALAGGSDVNGVSDVYRRRLSDGATALVSRPGIGAKVAFASDAGNLGAGPDYYGVYVRDVGAGTTILGSVDNA